MIQEIEIKPFYKLIDYLLIRYEMFDIDSLRSFKVFLNGYQMAIISNGIEDEDLKHFEGFDTFVNNKFNQMTTEGWVRIITKKCEKGKNPILFFAELLEEYKSTR